MSALDQLTPREYEIALLIAEGHRLKDIAEKLSRSIKTIETHKQRIKVKMEITTSVQWMTFLREFPYA